MKRNIFWSLQRIIILKKELTELKFTTHSFSLNIIFLTIWCTKFRIMYHFSPLKDTGEFFILLWVEFYDTALAFVLWSPRSFPYDKILDRSVGKAVDLVCPGGRRFDSLSRWHFQNLIKLFQIGTTIFIRSRVTFFEKAFWKPKMVKT